ncbi:protein phosphatase methylesterase [Sporormia fimetaria CBS 119925]|uniref:Protein phosphatase methylesterase 1 n=1 Tax=Sporormia fimetaria CBS 119925 TaxID=1340428 RepID=A0A6A6VLG9_9PLEO|nr:protein phosphatase methylesterase [Sporormia fimetaria CBS 119925]
MSDLAKTFIKSKLSSLPENTTNNSNPTPPSSSSKPPPSTTNGTNTTTKRPPPSPSPSDSDSSTSSISSTGTILPPPSQATPPPTTWPSYFTSELYLTRPATPNQPAAKYHIYLTPPQTPTSPLLILHHGAGSSALSFSLLAQSLHQHLPTAGILALDARNHGSVVWDSPSTPSTDFSLEALSDDLISILHLTQQYESWVSLPPLVLIGHSLGGAVITHVTSLTPTPLPSLLGYIVLDVVEGSAIEALSHMQTLLAHRPSSFSSVDEAIDWHIRSRTLRNPESARASVPSLLVIRKKDWNTGAGGQPGNWEWRTDLGATKPYWENWFRGMSGKFLAGRGAKMLILAGTDRLDKELMIGQMQGKFQLHVFPTAGHFVHEDVPEKTAEAVAEFVKRNDRSALVLPPKVSELLAQGKKV